MLQVKRGGHQVVPARKELFQKLRSVFRRERRIDDGVSAELVFQGGIRAVFQKKSDVFQFSEACGFHQRSASAVSGGVDGRAAFEEHPQNVRFRDCGSRMERGFAMRVFQIRICSVFQQNFRQDEVLSGCGGNQVRNAVPGGSVRVHSAVQH